MRSLLRRGASVACVGRTSHLQHVVDAREGPEVVEMAPGAKERAAPLCGARKRSRTRGRTRTTTQQGRGRSGGSDAVFRVSVAASVLELFNEDVGASSKLSARRPALPVESEGREAAFLNRLDALFQTVSSKLKSDEAFTIRGDPPRSRVAA